MFNSEITPAFFKAKPTPVISNLAKMSPDQPQFPSQDVRYKAEREYQMKMGVITPTLLETPLTGHQLLWKKVAMAPLELAPTKLIDMAPIFKTTRTPSYSSPDISLNPKKRVLQSPEEERNSRMRINSPEQTNLKGSIDYDCIGSDVLISFEVNQEQSISQEIVVAETKSKGDNTTNSDDWFENKMCDKMAVKENNDVTVKEANIGRNEESSEDDGSILVVEIQDDEDHLVKEKGLDAIMLAIGDAVRNAIYPLTVQNKDLEQKVQEQTAQIKDLIKSVNGLKSLVEKKVISTNMSCGHKGVEETLTNSDYPPTGNVPTGTIPKLKGGSSLKGQGRKKADPKIKVTTAALEDLDI